MKYKKIYSYFHFDFFDKILKKKREDMYQQIIDKIDMNRMNSILDVGTSSLDELESSNYLISLDLSDNQLTGEIPPEIGNLPNLTGLYLYYNQLTGEIPSWIGNLTNLTYLNLWGNQLTGEIPPEIGNLTNLNGLYLYSNQLTGEIPQEVCDIIDNNEWWIEWNINDILTGNNLINTCE